MKYIIRAEAHEDVFAIKFYAARDKRDDNKCNKILNIHSYSGSLRIFLTCASIVPIILEKYPLSSFIINGARSIDLKKNKYVFRSV